MQSLLTTTVSVPYGDGNVVAAGSSVPETDWTLPMFVSRLLLWPTSPEEHAATATREKRERERERENPHS
jgi:hypothetical protein